mgnify:CR=1 FL=1
MNAAAIQPYALLDDKECEQRIVRAKQTLGDRLVILGHHYQRDEVIQFADFRGDSLQLSRRAHSIINKAIATGLRSSTILTIRWLKTPAD